MEATGKRVENETDDSKAADHWASERIVRGKGKQKTEM